MKPLILATLAALLLAGCGSHPMTGLARVPAGFAAKSTIDKGAVLAKPTTGAPKPAIELPVPPAPRQGLGTKDAAAIATAAYAEAFAAKTPEAAVATAKLGYEKLKTILPANSTLQPVLRFLAVAQAEAEITDPEDARRLALWPLHFIGKGLTSIKEPAFFEMTARVLESMKNWQDGMQVALVAIDFLDEHPDGYVKTMVAKAGNKFRSPKVTLEDSYKITLAAMKEIQQTLEETKK